MIRRCFHLFVVDARAKKVTDGPDAFLIQRGNHVVSLCDVRTQAVVGENGFRVKKPLARRVSPERRKASVPKTRDGKVFVRTGRAARGRIRRGLTIFLEHKKIAVLGSVCHNVVHTRGAKTKQRTKQNGSSESVAHVITSRSPILEYRRLQIINIIITVGTQNVLIND